MICLLTVIETLSRVSSAIVARFQTGMITVSGGALALHLESDGRLRPPGTVPVGTYRLMARFPGVSGAVKAGWVTLNAGEHLRIRCDADRQTCHVE